MTNHRPLDADGNPPMEGQMDVYEVIALKREQTEEERIHEKCEETLDRPMTAAEIVAARLKGQ